MLISRTSQYAIQALIYIALKGEGNPILSREVAEQLGVPSAYLAKIMQMLCKGGVLTSFRGRLGGFCLRENAEKIDLMRVLLITEGQDFTTHCVLGLKQCSDETACPMHNKFLPIKSQIVDMLNGQNLADLAEAVKAGKYRLADIPGELMPVH
ncbi:DNA-binding protein [Novimethylophilus kurashikiensis]|jgi:Rrf2 family protein|uniref:DNA-binding protein n=1 Tax=Novimethylophilus kurashikiensis TaxID=1825523 RepID=A0A2R5FB50_9PROT|nr:Rrf2 family transcriptional regulator [Novimethylophilus kurashikiensis]GBG15456.1 DNA-binding protein [Novimethylophilus kurashikiensis]